MQFSFINSIFELPADDWNALWPSRYPFSQHAFFAALERSGSTNASTGWQASHCVAHADNELVFAMPLFIKTHSYGEYVFDWGWADAYMRAGLEYYPKLLNAIPFTPATGPRLASKHPLAESDVENLKLALIDKANAISASSIHALFPSGDSRRVFDATAFIQRKGHQYHWFNNGYQSFDDFMQDLSSRKRKNIKKERAKCGDYNITFHNGKEASEADWKLFYTLYHRTYLKRSGRPGYLTASFFTELAASLGEQIVLALVEHEGQKIAGAVYFKDQECLYGRYWGTLVDIDGLHFETCYYQGIEYAIKNKLSRFDPGAQGEHKIQRGFQPIETCSFHWLADARFSAAVEDFCIAEAEDNARYIEQAREYLPFKEGHPLVDARCLLTQDHSNSGSSD